MPWRVQQFLQITIEYSKYSADIYPIFKLINTLVIVPTYNEVDNIQKFIDSVFIIDGLSLLVVDDNSPDGTAKIVESNFENYQNLHLLKRRESLGWVQHILKDLNGF